MTTHNAQTSIQANLQANIQANEQGRISATISPAMQQGPTIDEVFQKSLEIVGGYSRKQGDILKEYYQKERMKAILFKKNALDLFGLKIEDAAKYPLRLYIWGDPIEFFSKQKIKDSLMAYISRIEHLFSSEEEMLRSLITKRMPDGRRIIPVIRDAAGIENEHEINRLSRILDTFYYDPSQHLFIISFEPLDFVLMSDVAAYRSCHSLGGTYFAGNYSWAHFTTSFLWMKVDKTKDLAVPYKMTRSINILGRGPIEGIWGIRQQRNYPHIDLSTYFPRILVKRLLGAEKLIVKHGGIDHVRFKGKEVHMGNPVVYGAYIDPPQVVGLYVRRVDLLNEVSSVFAIEYFL